MTYAILGLVVLFFALLTPTLVWLHAEVKEGKHLRDRLEEQTKLSEEYRSGRDVEAAAHAVTKDELDKEKYLRKAAEAQRDEAQKKARAYLARNLSNASEGELNAIVADLFSPLGSVRPQVPTASPATSNDSDLEKP